MCTSTTEVPDGRTKPVDYCTQYEDRGLRHAPQLTFGRLEAESGSDVIIMRHDRACNLQDKEVQSYRAAEYLLRPYLDSCGTGAISNLMSFDSRSHRDVEQDMQYLRRM